MPLPNTRSPGSRRLTRPRCPSSTLTARGPSGIVRVARCVFGGWNLPSNTDSRTERVPTSRSSAPQRNASDSRFADPCRDQAHHRAIRLAHRVMASVTRFITTRLKLSVNASKSAVARPQDRKFLGFSFTAGPEVKRVIAPKALGRFKARVRGITRRAKGVSIETTIADLAGTCGVGAAFRHLRNARRAGVPDPLGPVAITRGPVATVANTAPPPSGAIGTRGPSAAGQPYGRQRSRSLVPRPGQGPLGGPLQRLFHLARTSDVDRRVLAQPTRTAVYGPVRTVVWQGSAGNRRPYADLTAQGRSGGRQIRAPVARSSDAAWIICGVQPLRRAWQTAGRGDLGGDGNRVAAGKGRTST